MHSSSFGELRSQKIILGNLPFLGISYQGRRKDEEYKEKFSDKAEMKKIMRVALQHNVKLFAASSHGFNELAPIYLEAVKEMEEEEETDIPLIACMGVPLSLRGSKIDDYRRWKTHLAYETEQFGKEVTDKVFDDPVLNCRFGWKKSLQDARPYATKQLEKELKIIWDIWEESVNRLSDWKIARIEPGSETDFLAISRIDLLGELLDRNHELGHRTLLGSHHLGASVPLIEEGRLEMFDGYVTPVNRLGVMMFPSQREAERAIGRTKEQDRLVVAIKPFAGGRIEPRNALSYVYREVEADACMMGVGSVEEAETDFQAARDILGRSKAESFTQRD